MQGVVLPYGPAGVFFSLVVRHYGSIIVVGGGAHSVIHPRPDNRCGHYLNY